MIMYKSMKTEALYMEYYSAWFSDLRRRVEWGNVPFFYLCFINDLISELVASSYNFMSDRSMYSQAVIVMCFYDFIQVGT